LPLTILIRYPSAGIFIVLLINCLPSCSTSSLAKEPHHLFPARRRCPNPSGLSQSFGNISSGVGPRSLSTAPFISRYASLCAAEGASARSWMRGRAGFAGNQARRLSRDRAGPQSRASLLCAASEPSSHTGSG